MCIVSLNGLSRSCLNLFYLISQLTLSTLTATKIRNRRRTDLVERKV